MKELLDSLSGLIDKVGWPGAIAILFILGIIYTVSHFKSIVLAVIEIYEKVRVEKHAEELRRRDKLNEELQPMFREMRAATRADRLLYFEYHNSKENLVGTPFKYVDLVMSERAAGIPYINCVGYKDINAGLICDLYSGLRYEQDGIVLNNDDSTFTEAYPGVSEFLGNLKQGKQMYINLPGLHDPVGFIVLEWYNPEVDLEEHRQEAVSYRNRVNVIVTSKQYSICSSEK